MTAPDFFNTNFFDPPKPEVPHEYKSPQSLVPKAPKVVPGEDRLWQVQKNALRALQDLRSLDSQLPPKILKSPEWVRLNRDVENTYRVIRTWLSENTDQAGGYG